MNSLFSNLKFYVWNINGKISGISCSVTIVWILDRMLKQMGVGHYNKVKYCHGDVDCHKNLPSTKAV